MIILMIMVEVLISDSSFFPNLSLNLLSYKICRSLMSIVQFIENLYCFAKLIFVEKPI